MLNLLMLSIYIILNIYIIWRIGMWIDYAFSFHIKVNIVLKISAAFVCVVASSTLMIWLLFPQGHFAVFLIRLGNYWLGFFIESIACLIISDILMVVINKISKKRRHELHPTFHKIYGGAVLAITLLLTVSGCINAGNIHVNSYGITVEKKSDSPEKLKVVLLGDVHMGYNIGCKQVKQMVEKTNALQPDLILIAGDIFDNNYDALDNPEELSRLYRSLKAKDGVYAVFGNHDVKAKLVGGFTVGGSRLRDPRMENFLKDSNITLLLDDTITIENDSIYLVGRLDGEHTGEKTKRKSIYKLMEKLDRNKTLFVMNHEPVKMEEYAKEHVDVLFSGHTHDGQFFPLTFMNPFVWKNAHGCKKIDDMYSLVTSGVGVYGPFMRTFTEAEIMEVNIRFE